jgi:anti-sigma factor RsiW
METTCSRYRSELSALLDGQLDSKDHNDVQGHLNNCENCTAEFEALKKLTMFLVAEMNSERVPVPDIWGQLQAHLPSVCQVMEDDLSAYLDGELSPAAQEGVNRHLKECASCLDSFKRLNAANRMLSKGLELPANFKVDLWAAIKSQLNEDCALIRSELSAYADQEVVNLRHRNITNHLIDCQDCRVAFNRLSALGDVVRESYKPKIPDDFDLWPGIRAKMQVVPFVPRSGAKQNAGRPRLIAGAVAAAVVVTSGIVISLMIPKDEPNGGAISSEAYLIESALREPSDQAEAAVYEE